MTVLNSKDFTYSQDYPALNWAKDDDWRSQTFFPVPLDYFFKLHCADFWTVAMQSKGEEAAHLGPKVIGSSWASRTKTEVNYPINFEDLPMMDINIPPKEVALVRNETERLLRRETIFDNVNALNLLPDTSKAVNTSDVNITAPDPHFLQPTVFESQTINSVDRDFEIADLFVDNRAALAVDTMGTMSEHLFLCSFYSHGRTGQRSYNTRRVPTVFEGVQARGNFVRMERNQHGTKAYPGYH
ncbi:hypothetical protein DL98DRAFT_148759 [Cadophora sp. DSE1049]|nr:hypothetical protein DL98DRAFT_148759 [Cadophora sp. DSE1049]